MTIFVDASALVAMIKLEPDYSDLADRLRAENTCITSAVAVWEAVVAISSSNQVPVETAREEIDALIAASRISIVTIGEAEADAALHAYQHYGKGRHPARLNMGDCFAYACAKANNASLLYKGNDFTYTDLA